MKYTQSRIIYTKKNSKEYRIEFLNNLNKTFTDFDFKTKVEGTSIEFEKIFRSTTNSGYNRREAFKSLRTGRIDLFIQSNNIIIVKSSIDLSHLTFLTVFFGICIFFFGWFWDSNLIGIGMLSIITMLIVFFIGWASVASKIDRIIKIAMKKT